MRCVLCASSSTQVVDTRPAADGVRRRRECERCGGRFTTYERAEQPRVTVIKRDGSRERFDRQKLVRGLARAAGGRPVSEEQLDAIADWVVRELRAAGGEVPAEQVGDLAERGLARVDPVSAIQFASVYRNLADLDELEAVVRRFKDEPLPGSDQLALGGDRVPSDPRSSIDRSPSGESESVAHTRRGHVPQP
ncbi:MAG TPA: transcriptional regulator NrdR [Thermoleophilaceae bacterium]|jgi:transcriptional repressor NrdR|nr:transcriptional regulator NrdR [Thermoleophilaceae bacterium]